MPSITISIGEEERKILEKRAKKNLMTLRGQIEDIIRRSAVNYKKGTSNKIKIDDKLVAAFSRDGRGRPRKKKKVKKK
jgi:hypothetical protein